MKEDKLLGRDKRKPKEKSLPVEEEKIVTKKDRVATASALVKPKTLVQRPRTAYGAFKGFDIDTYDDQIK